MTPLRRISNLGLLAISLTFLLILEIIYLKYFRTYETDNEVRLFTFNTLLLVIRQISFWGLLGRAFGQLKSGLIVAGLVLTMSLTFDYMFIEKWIDPTSNWREVIRYFYRYIPAILFSFLVFKTLSKRLQLIGLFIVLSGNYALNYGFEVSEFVGQLSRAFGLDMFRDGLISVKIPTGETSYYIIGLDYLLVFYAYLIVQFILLNYSRQIIENGWRFSLKKWQEFQLGNPMTKGKMTGYIFAFYICILVVGVGMVNGLMKLDEVPDGMAGFELVFKLILSFLGLCIMTWFYRKALIEFYLNHHRSIGLNYYLLQIPIVGIIVWLVNLLTFSTGGTLNEKQLDELLSKGRFGVGLLLVTASLIGLIVSISNQDDTGVVMRIISLFILLLFIMVRQGMATIIIVKLTIFLGLFLLLFMDIEIREITNAAGEWLDWSYFLSMVFLFIMHPIFHLRTQVVSGVDDSTVQLTEPEL